jgi:hypothetical protein
VGSLRCYSLFQFDGQKNKIVNFFINLIGFKNLPVGVFQAQKNFFDSILVKFYQFGTLFLDLQVFARLENVSLQISGSNWFAANYSLVVWSILLF